MLLAALAGWLVVASAGIVAAGGLAPGLRLALVAALWALGGPALWREVALRSRTSVRQLVHRGRRDWQLHDGGGVMPALPQPYGMTLGAVVWLAFATARGRRRACVIDRALAVRLRFAGGGSGAARGRAARITPGT